ncbi:MAG: hypothetical protein RBS87_07000 [Acholeplasma sp.]|jgi:hypothetical protein|nr:hypothetical protein [Acholeplasma sp.]
MITRTKYFREKYIRACVALYGIVHEQRVQQLYEMHLDEKLDLTNLNHKFLDSDGIKYDQGYFIHEYIFYSKLMTYYLNEKANKPYYTPTWESLSRYESIYHIDHTSEITRFAKELRRHGVFRTEDRFYIILNSILSFNLMSYQMGKIVDVLKDAFLSDESFKVIVPLMIEALNSQKLWINNGYSPIELKRIKPPYEKPLDVELINPFEVTPELADNFKRQVRRSYPRLPLEIQTLSLPGYDDLMNYLIDRYPSQVIDLEPNVFLAAVIGNTYYQHNKKFSYNRRDAVYRALGVLGKQEEIDPLISHLMVLLEDYKTDQLEVILKTFYEQLAYFPVQSPNKEHIRQLLVKQKSTSVDDKKRKEIEKMAEGVLNHKDAYKHLYNLVNLYPLSVKNLNELIKVCPKEQQETLLKAIINAFEISDYAYIEQPNQYKPNHQNFKTYLLSLSTLGFFYKQRQAFSEAIKVYEKCLHCDYNDHNKVKESILACYFYTKKYNQFMDLLETMNQGGIHRIFMDFYHQVLDQISIQETYEIIQNKYPKILAELLSNRPNLDVTRVFEEQEFLNDFHPIFLANKRAIQQAIQSLESTKLIN